MYINDNRKVTSASPSSVSVMARRRTAQARHRRGMFQRHNESPTRRCTILPSLKNTIFEEYLKAFMLPSEDERHWIPAARGGGLLVTLFETLVLPHGRSSKSVRSTQARTFYNGGVQIAKHKIKRRNATNLENGYNSQVYKYIFRKFPYPAFRETEMRFAPSSKDLNHFPYWLFLLRPKP